MVWYFFFLGFGLRLTGADCSAEQLCWVSLVKYYIRDFFLKKKRCTEEVNLFLHWISLFWELFSVLHMYVPCGWGGCWFSSRHKVETCSPVLCLLCASELHIRVYDKARSPYISTRKMLRDLSGNRNNDNLQCIQLLHPCYGNYFWSMVHRFSVAVVIKYSKQSIKDIMDVQTDPSIDSMVVRSMPIWSREKSQSRLFRSVIWSYSSAVIKTCVNRTNLFWSCLISAVICKTQ